MGTHIAISDTILGLHRTTIKKLSTGCEGAARWKHKASNALLAFSYLAVGSGTLCLKQDAMLPWKTSNAPFCRTLVCVSFCEGCMIQASEGVGAREDEERWVSATQNGEAMG